MIVQLQKQNIDTNNGFRQGLHNTLWKKLTYFAVINVAGCFLFWKNVYRLSGILPSSCWVITWFCQ